MNRFTAEKNAADLKMNGMEVLTSKFLTVQFRFPRTKNRRIRKKWTKRAENFKPSDRVYADTARRVVYMHPAMAQKLRQMLSREFRESKL